GYQATVSSGEEQPAVVLNQLVDTVRHTGGIGVVGLYLPSDPGAPDEHSAEGELLYRIGRFFEKGQTMGTGQADAKRYAHQLRDLTIEGRAAPSTVVPQHIPPPPAPDAYPRLPTHDDGSSNALPH